MNRLGNIDLNTPGTTQEFSFSGTGVPSDAREILVYITLATAHNASTDTDVELTVWTSDGKQDYKKYLYGRAYNQQAWSYNSQNMFFPATSDKKLRVSVAYSNSPGSGNMSSVLYVIGYRE